MSPERPTRPDDDDAFVVDTRRGPRRASGSRSTRPPQLIPLDSRGRATDAPPDAVGRRTRPAAPFDDDDAYVVDTRQSDDWDDGDDRGSDEPPRGPRGAGSGGGPTKKPRRLRRVILTIVGLLVAWLVFLVGVPLLAWNGVARVDNIPAGERPENTSGYNYLLVGSDSREGLTAEEKRELKTGSAEGKRTDTIMLIHVSESGGRSVLVSIPRDSYVPVPGNGSQKINAAYAIGGPKLLTQTVEQATGIHIDGYVEIGLGGFANMVEAIGGVNVCVKADMNDPKAGIDLKKGCQVLDGKNALGYVRSRYVDPLGDIGRAARQRQFLGALMKQAATPSTVILPWRYKSFVDAGVSGLTVGEETSAMDAYRLLMAMRDVSGDNGLSLTVPIGDMNYQTSNSGLAIKWDTEKALALFRALRDDTPLTEAPAGTDISDQKN